MRIVNFFERCVKGDWLHKAVKAQNLSRIYNVLEDIVGEGGVTISKPTRFDGRGWKIRGSHPLPPGETYDVLTWSEGGEWIADDVRAK